MKTLILTWYHCYIHFYAIWIIPDLTFFDVRFYDIVFVRIEMRPTELKRGDENGTAFDLLMLDRNDS